MKRRIGIFVVSALIIGMAAGCAENPEKRSGRNQVEDYAETDDHVSARIGEYFVIDAEIRSRPERLAYETVRCSWDDSDKREQYRQCLFSEEEQLFHWWRESTEGPVYAYVCDDGYITYDMYGDESSNRSLTAYAARNAIIYNADQYGNDIRWSLVSALHSDGIMGTLWDPYPERLIADGAQELDGYSRDEAAAGAHELLQNLGYEACGEPFALYAIKTADYPEELQMALEQEELIYPDSPYTWQGDEEFYYMLWLDELNGLPIVTGDRPKEIMAYAEVREFPEVGTYTAILMSRDGLLALYRGGASFAETGREEARAVIGLEEALSSIEDYYKDAVIKSEHTVYTATFCYAPVLTDQHELAMTAEDGEALAYTQYEFDMLPVWCFEVRSEKDMIGLYYDMIYVNAYNGEIVK